MNNKNAEQIKAYSKGQLFIKFTASTQLINKAKKELEDGANINYLIGILRCSYP